MSICLRSSLIVLVIAAICTAGGGVPEQKHGPRPAPVTVVIEEEPADYLALALTYGLPAAGTIIAAIVGAIWIRKRGRQDAC